MLFTRLVRLATAKSTHMLFRQVDDSLKAGDLETGDSDSLAIGPKHANTLSKVVTRGLVGAAPALHAKACALQMVISLDVPCEQHGQLPAESMSQDLVFVQLHATTGTYRNPGRNVMNDHQQFLEAAQVHNSCH